MKTTTILKPVIAITISGFILAYVLSSSVAFGATQEYLYVNQNGVVQKINAESASDAFAKATDISLHSGVMVVDQNKDLTLVGEAVPVSGNTSTGTSVYATGGSVDNLYMYVDNNGNIRTVVADTPEEAIAIAPNRDTNSGVMRAI